MAVRGIISNALLITTMVRVNALETALCRV
jgi:hypothetical protein